MKISYLMISFLVLFFVSCTEDPIQKNIYQELKSVDKMVLANMALTKTSIFNHEDNFKIGKRISAYSYDNYLRAYIDLSELKEDDLRIDKSSNTITVTLPSVQTEIVGRDMEVKKVYDNVGFFRSNISAKERNEIIEKTNKDFLKELNENPMFINKLKETARNKAKIYFKQLLESEGFNVVVNFK